MMDHLLDPDDEDTRAMREDALRTVRQMQGALSSSNWSEEDDDIFEQLCKALAEAERCLILALDAMEDTP